ncbi:hypothetical protein BDW74DRAFT_181056 [Aspergillus multicolor]|uniref:BTB/POZ domain-containing protein n=1 Tax=Aspergillus multicolor TaxID=41759 RepID=UPI003CCCFC27
MAGSGKSTTTAVAKPASILRESMKELLENGRFSDMTITCQGHSFKVHRAIVCSQSRFFLAAMEDDFKKSKTQAVELPEDDLVTVARMISFLYTADYKDDECAVNLTSPPGSSTTTTTSTSTSPSKLAPFKALAEKLISATAKNPSEGVAKAEPRSPARNNLLLYVLADK